MATNRIDQQFFSALQSCINQEFDDFEIVLVANGVTDKEFSVASEYCLNLSKVRMLRTDLRYLTFSLNYGLDLCAGRYIARMDADDLSHPARLKTQYEFLERNPDFGMCGTDCYLIDGNGDVVGEWRYPKSNKRIRLQLRWKNPICHPTVMIRRQELTQIGGYSGLHCEDYSTWLALAESKHFKFANLPEKLLSYRANYGAHPRNITWVRAKAGVAASCLRQALITKDVSWLIGCFYNGAKAIWGSVLVR